MKEGSIFDAPMGRSAPCHPPCQQHVSSSVALLAGRKRGRPAAVESVDGMSSFVASEMNKLSFSERETVYEELHAVSTATARTDKEVAALMAQLRERISTIRRNKKAYNKAVFLNPEYVDSSDFLYIFLVAESFNPSRAAMKVVDHFTCKMNLFGPHLLSRRISYDDLNEDDKNCLLTGSFQVLGSDRGGRKVMLGTPRHEYKVVENQFRVMWYQFMKILEEKDTLKNGVVCLYLQSGFRISEQFHADFYYKSSIIQKGLPLIVKGFHFCYDTELFRPIMSAIQFAIGNHMRLRFRSHYGSPMEVQYALQSFGIPEDLLPIGRHGELCSDGFHANLAAAVEKERAEAVAQPGRIFSPTPLDVLLGRGRHPQEHEGNRNLAKIVEGHATTYRQTPKHEKRRAHMLVVKTIHAQGGRFLKRADEVGNGWVEVDAHTAVDKVRNRFREAGPDHV